jgi:uncharacterized membrane protein
VTIPVEIIVCILTAIGTGITCLLTVVVHQMLRISAALDSIKSRNAVEDERHSNLAKDVTDIQARLDRKGVLA